MKKMNLQNLAHIAEIIGGVAVLVSLIYLAVQLSDNNKLLRSQAHFNALELTQEPLMLTVENADLAEIIVKCDSAEGGLPQSMLNRCHNFYFIQYNGWEYLYYQNIDESIPPEIWMGADSYYREEISQKEGYVEFWRKYKVAFADPFRSYVDELFGINSRGGT